MAEKKINGRTFKVDPLGVMDALTMQARIMAVVAPQIDKVLTFMSARGDGASEEARAAGDKAALAALGGIFSALSPTEYAELIRDIVQIAQVQGKAGQYDQVDIEGDFYGDAKSIFPLAVFVLQVQFQDFFAGALASGRPSTQARA